MKKLLIIISLIFITCRFGPCIKQGAFDLNQDIPISPQGDDVPLNAVVRIAFLSEGQISDDAFTDSNTFKLERVTDQKKESTTGDKSSDKTDQGSDQSQSSNSQTNGTGRVEYKTEAVKVVVKAVKGGKVADINKNIQSSQNMTDSTSGIPYKTPTTVYVIPVPSVDRNSPLVKGSKYILTIGQMEDENGNTYPGTTISFTTTGKKGFTFQNDVSVTRVIEPKSSSGPVATNQEFIVEFDKPVNPLKLRTNSVLSYSWVRDSIDAEKVTEKQLAAEAGADAPGELLDKKVELEKDLKKAAEDRDFCLEIQNDESSSDSLKAEAKSKEAAQDELIKGLEAAKKELETEIANATGTASNGTNADEPKQKSSGYDPITKEDIAFTLSILEDLDSQSSKKYIKLNYNKFDIATSLDTAYKYKLDLKIEKGKSISVTGLNEIEVGTLDSFKRSAEIEKLLEIKFPSSTSD